MNTCLFCLTYADTHKFESRYLDLLIGPYPGAKDVYDARSPIKHVEGFKLPIIFFQVLAICLTSRCPAQAVYRLALYAPSHV